MHRDVAGEQREHRDRSTFRQTVRQYLGCELVLELLFPVQYRGNHGQLRHHPMLEANLNT